MNDQFDWNSDKAAANIRKHGIHFEEACSIFNDPLYITFRDDEHYSDEDRYFYHMLRDDEHYSDEDRYFTIGMSSQNRLLLIVHSDQDERIRIMSARKATAHERRFYQEEH